MTALSLRDRLRLLWWQIRSCHEERCRCYVTRRPSEHSSLTDD